MALTSDGETVVARDGVDADVVGQRAIRAALEIVGEAHPVWMDRLAFVGGIGVAGFDDQAAAPLGVGLDRVRERLGLEPAAPAAEHGEVALGRD